MIRLSRTRFAIPSTVDDVSDNTDKIDSVITTQVQTVAATATLPGFMSPIDGQLIHVSAKSSAGAAAGESLVVDVHKNGVPMTTAAVTLDQALGTDPGEGVADTGAPGAMELGDLITYDLVYTAGGTPTPLANITITAMFSVQTP